MTLFRGLFVRKDAVRGTTPVEARKALGGLIVPASASSFGVRPGILRGLVVSGTAGWAYSVDQGYAVTARSAADGGVLFGNDAATTVDCSAAPATGSRIDIVYVQHLDVDAADATSDVVLAVAEGDASGTPVPPTIPTGALELARATVTSTATSTSSAGTTITQTGPFTALAGADFQVPDEDSLDRIVDPIDGSRAWVDAENGHYVRAGGSWRLSPDEVGPVTSGLTIPDAGSGYWATTVYAFYRRNGVTWFDCGATYSGPTITFGADGNTSDINAVVVPNPWRPGSGIRSYWKVDVEEAGSRQWFGRINASGVLTISHGLPNQTLVSGKTIWWQGSFPSV